MPTFHYQGTTRQGKNIKGAKDAVSKQAALSELTAEGVFVSELAEKNKSKKFFSKELFSRKKNLADLFFQLSLLLRSGIPLVESLRIIEKSEKGARDKAALADVADKISEGKKFSEALAAHEKYFEPMYVNLIKASERVGHLSEILMDIAEYEENKRKSSDKLLSAMIYPMVILIIGLGVVAFMLTVIVPKIQGIFDAAKQELPGVTKLLLSIAGFVQKYGLALFIFVLVLLLLFRYMYGKNDKFRLRVDKRMYGFNLIAQSITSRFAHVVAFQLKEGLPLSDALFHANQTIKNVYVKEILADVREKVMSGVKFSTALKDTSVFPDLFPAAVSTGESSGNMHELLERVSEFYSKKLENYTTAFLSVVEPLFIVIVGVMIGFVVISIMLPLLSINTMIN